MGGDESKLIAAGKKADKDEPESGVFQGPLEHKAHGLVTGCSLDSLGRTHHLKREHRHQNDAGKHHKHRLPWHLAEQHLCNGWPYDLASRTCRGGNPQRHRPVFLRRRTTNHRENDTEPRSGNPKTYKHFEKLMLSRRDCECGQYQPQRINESPGKDRLSVAKSLCQCAKNGLPDTPEQVLDSNRQRKRFPWPGKF